MVRCNTIKYFSIIILKIKEYTVASNSDITNHLLVIHSESVPMLGPVTRRNREEAEGLSPQLKPRGAVVWKWGVLLRAPLQGTATHPQTLSFCC